MFNTLHMGAGGYHRERSPPTSSKSKGLFASILSLASVVRAGEEGLSGEQVGIVVQRLAEGATHSWEYGTRQQTLIELDTPSFSVLTPNAAVPPSRSAPDDDSLATVIDIITDVVKNRASTLASSGDYSGSGPQPLFPGEGSAADPASNGVAALVANWVGKSTDDVDFAGAAADQLDFLLSDSTPKTDDGAFSHRTEQVQLWSDFVYMVPPFLAYYGVLTQNQSLIHESYNQIRLYRNYLRDASNGGLWKHVVMGDWEDQGYWSTGNGWAAAGMLRVLGTIQNSRYNTQMAGQLLDLKVWVEEIHDAMYPYVRDDGLFYNYANNESTFPDASSAALLAATVYRHALLTGSTTHIADAESARRKLWAPSSGEGNDYVDAATMEGMAHFTGDGWLTPVVNPDSFGEEGGESPEGQAFVGQLYAAWRDWKDAGSPGAEGGSGGGGSKKMRGMGRGRQYGGHKL